LLKDGDYLRVGTTVEVGGYTLTADEIELRTRPKGGFAVADEGGLAVAVDTELDAELEDEGLARELIHFIQGERKNAGFEIADRIIIEMVANERAQHVLDRFADEIRHETLCTQLTLVEETDGVSFASEACVVRVRLTREA